MCLPDRGPYAASCDGHREWWVSELIPRFTKIFEYSKNFEVIVFGIKNCAFKRNLSPWASSKAANRIRHFQNKKCKILWSFFSIYNFFISNLWFESCSMTHIYESSLNQDWPGVFQWIMKDAKWNDRRGVNTKQKSSQGYHF